METLIALIVTLVVVLLLLWCVRVCADRARRGAVDRAPLWSAVMTNSDDVTFNCGYCGWRDTVPDWKREDGERIFREHLKRCWRHLSGKPMREGNESLGAPTGLLGR